MRWTLATFAALCLCLSPSTTPVAAPVAEPELIVPPRPVAAGPDFRWTFMIKIRNRLQYGLYVDSMWTEVADLDPGVTGLPRTTRIPLQIAMRSRPAISAGDSLQFSYSGNAIAESALVTIRMHAHDGTGKSYARSGRVAMRPASQSGRARSEKIAVAGRAIELVRVDGTGATPSSGPGVVIVHGHGSNARRMLPAAWSVAGHGFSVVLVSLPGYGLSEGPAEFAGPVSVAAIEAALDTLRHMAGVDTSRIGLWGLGHGAAAAALVARRQPNLAAVALTAGVYDLEAIERDSRSPALRDLIRRDAGRDPVQRRLRAPIEQASALHMPVMLVHSPADTIAPFAQARAYEAALRSNGVRVQMLQTLGAGHFVPQGDQDLPELVFLREHVLMRHILAR